MHRIWRVRYRRVSPERGNLGKRKDRFGVSTSVVISVEEREKDEYDSQAKYSAQTS